MRVYGPSGTRSYPTDRNPTTVATGTPANNGGSSTITIATYTVPVGRRALVSAMIAGDVITALGAAQTGVIRINVTPSGGALAVVAGADFEVAAAAGINRVVPPGQYALKAGDLITLTVGLTGTGNLVGTGGIQGVEYDA